MDVEVHPVNGVDIAVVVVGLAHQVGLLVVRGTTHLSENHGCRVRVLFEDHPSVSNMHVSHRTPPSLLLTSIGESSQDSPLGLHAECVEPVLRHSHCHERQGAGHKEHRGKDQQHAQHNADDHNDKERD